MTLQVLAKDKLGDFVCGLLTEFEVAGPVPKENRHTFAPISSPDELALDYVTTVLPPKKFLLPQHEPLLTFSVGDQVRVEPVIEATPRVLFGVHTCDLRGIAQLDRAMLETHRDQHYAARREATALIGLDDMPDEQCFCGSIGSATHQGRCDVFLTPVGDEYVVEAVTEMGAQLLSQHAETKPAQSAHVAGIREHLDRKLAAQEARLNGHVSGLPLLLDAAWNSAVWKKWSEEKCWSCARCNLVCPTCFCFDVYDRVELTLTDGRRERVWDACMSPEFALVASGENFRDEKVERLRHRFYRKFHYLYTKQGEPYCTGCGRCGRACVPGITITNVLNDLFAESGEEA